MNKIINRRQPTSQLTLSNEKLDLSQKMDPILKRIYENRGIKSETELDRRLGALLPYHSLTDINKAVELLYAHISQQKRILIVGDFDADGATSSTLAVSVLKAFGAKHVNYLVPNRFEFGYGLTPEIVAVGAEWKPDLIITVDNGISSCEGVAAANERGIKVLVTDHHLPGNKLPEAEAIVNPNQNGDEFGSKNLAGVGVIFYVMLALRRYLLQKNWFAEQKITEPNMADYLDLVALGTVADVVPLDQNNRILVYQGLQRIRLGHCRPGILALLDVAKRKRESLAASDLGFAIGPRLNAAGRLDDMSLGIECLLAENKDEALDYAEHLDELNKERRVIEGEMQQQALKDLARLQEKLNKKLESKLKDEAQLPRGQLPIGQLPIGLCLYDENWHQGVIGILASRIKDRFHRPVIAFALGDNNCLKGSARSISGLHIRDVLDAVATQNPDLISKFGGHAMAAGLSLEKEKFALFTKAFDKEVRKHLSEKDLKQEIQSDGELQQHEINLDLAQTLRNAGPWGQAFPEPTFDGIFSVVSQRIVGAKHLKLVLKVGDAKTGDQRMIDAIAFNVNTEVWPNHRCERIRAAYRLDVNEYLGVCKAQLIIEYFYES